MSQAAAAESELRPGPVLSHREIVTVITGLMMGMFLAALDQTVVSSAIRVIADQLHSLTLQAWS